MIRTVQAAHFRSELTILRRGKPLSTKSMLISLGPLSDSEGVLRVGGRLKHSLLEYDERHPIILPRSSALTKLIVKSCHLRTLYGGVQQTLGLIRQRFWIPQGRRIVRGFIHQCVICLRWRAASPTQMMGVLPPATVTLSRPFLKTGVDYAGSINVRVSPGRG